MSDTSSIIIIDSESEVSSDENIYYSVRQWCDIHTSESFEESDEEEYEEVFIPEEQIPLLHSFVEIPGPKHIPQSGSHPVVYFDIFFTSTLLSLIVKETNRNANIFFTNISQAGGSVSSVLKQWEDVTDEEIKAFFACILNMGINKKATLGSYWSTTSSQHSPWFGLMLSKRRFSNIFKFFQFINNEDYSKLNEPGYDATTDRYQPLLQHANNVFRHHYTPHQQLIVGESFIEVKRKSIQLQNLPEIKLGMLYDSVSNYCLEIFTYVGAKHRTAEENCHKYESGSQVVMKLLHLNNYLNKGYHVFVDNFFMSIPLVRSLYQLGTYMTGTLGIDRNKLPNDVKTAFSVGEKKYFRSGCVLVYGYNANKSQKHPVVFVSSKSKVGDVRIASTHGGGEILTTKPIIVADYEKYAKGVKTSDVTPYTYFDERRSVKYWKKVCFSIISRMVFNSYILYKENEPDSQKTRLQFTIDIVEKMGKDWVKSKCIDKKTKDPLEQRGLTKLPGRREAICSVCSKPSKRRRSRTVCFDCNKGVHEGCYFSHKC